MAKPLGISNPLLPKVPLGLGGYQPNLQFLRPIGSQLLTVLNPALFQPKTPLSTHEAPKPQVPSDVEELQGPDLPQSPARDVSPEVQLRTEKIPQTSSSTLNRNKILRTTSIRDLSTIDEDTNYQTNLVSSLDQATTKEPEIWAKESFNEETSISPSSSKSLTEELSPGNDFQQEVLTTKSLELQPPSLIPKPGVSKATRLQSSVVSTEPIKQATSPLPNIQDSALPNVSPKIAEGKVSSEFPTPNSLGDDPSLQESVSLAEVVERVADYSQLPSPLEEVKQEPQPAPVVPVGSANEMEESISPFDPSLLQTKALAPGREVKAVLPFTEKESNLSHHVPKELAQTTKESVPSSADVQSPTVEDLIQSRKDVAASEPEIQSQSQTPAPDQAAPEAKTITSQSEKSSTSLIAPENTVNQINDRHSSELTIRDPDLQGQSSSIESDFNKPAQIQHKVPSESSIQAQFKLNSLDLSIPNQLGYGLESSPTPVDNLDGVQELLADASFQGIAPGSSGEFKQDIQSLGSDLPESIPQAPTKNISRKQGTNDGKEDIIEDFVTCQPQLPELPESKTQSDQVQYSRGYAEDSKPQKHLSPPKLQQVLKPIGVLKSLKSDLSKPSLLLKSQGIAEQALHNMQRQAGLSAFQIAPERASQKILPNQVQETFTEKALPHFPNGQEVWEIQTDPMTSGSVLSDFRTQTPNPFPAAPSIHLTRAQTPSPNNWHSLTELAAPSQEKWALPKDLPSQAPPQALPAFVIESGKAEQENEKNSTSTVIAPPPNSNPFPDLHPLQLKKDDQITKPSALLKSTGPQEIDSPQSSEDSQKSKLKPESPPSLEAVEKLARYVYQIVRKRLMVEQERQGRFNRRLG